MTKYVTVVYAIEDEEAFKPIMQDIQKQMSEFDVNNRPAVGICAASSSNEIQRLEMIEDDLNGSDAEMAQDAAQSILSMAHLPELNQEEVLLA
ncbi:hypothetical protein [Vibrio cholerae]|uniref:hypothetical protein n=1 Tax=Vibrio cholerae TaxID=666 RepID=UPI0011D55DDD|nr:hypothetical protein [Vibrio cholerae]TXY52069.1 hypothetical protein FXE74_18990 [Vibrio cholerae]GIB31793.1 hypothetical protein VCSRO91_2828 [Vibrio cholerae]